jgi:hypothetical protein
MAEHLLKDPTVWHWSFYLRRHAFEPPGHVKEHWDEFAGVLESAAKRFNLQIAIPRQPDDREFSLRLADVPWHPEPDGLLATLDSRTLLDSYYVELGFAQEGNFSPDAFSVLKKKASVFESRHHSYLGRTTLLSCEVPKDVGSEKIASIASESLSAFVDQSAPGIEILKLSTGFLGIPFRTDVTAWIYFLLDDDESRSRASHLIHRILPALFLAQLKVEQIMRDFLEQLWPESQRLEADLSEELVRISKGKMGLKDLEAASYSIAQAQVELSRRINHCEELLQTLQVNASNMARRIQDPMFADVRSDLERILLEPVLLNTEQIRTDLSYLSITQVQADRQVQGIQTMAAVRSARWERMITLLVAVFAPFALIEAFSEELGSTYRAPAALFLITVFLICIFLMQRNKKDA